MSGVHVVILAAGKGSRMGGLGGDTPKWLLRVGRQTIADHHVEALQLAAPVVASARVVTGHAHQAIDHYLANRPGPLTVYNPAYATLNNWYSVLVALRAIDDPEARVVVLNSDLFANPTWIASFLEAAASTPTESLIAVDRERRLTDESMKVAVDVSDGDRLAKIGKVGIDAPIGEYVGMLMARGSVLQAFQRTLESFEGQQETANEWYERAAGLSAAAGSDWRVWATPDSRWVEIDDDADHALAVKMDGEE